MASSLTDYLSPPSLSSFLPPKKFFYVWWIIFWNQLDKKKNVQNIIKIDVNVEILVKFLLNHKFFIFFNLQTFLSSSLTRESQHVRQSVLNAYLSMTNENTKKKRIRVFWILDFNLMQPENNHQKCRRNFSYTYEFNWAI